jgi:hypothetical protein
MVVASVRRVVCKMLKIWKGIFLFSFFVASFGDVGDVAFTPGKPWDEYTGNL